MDCASASQWSSSVSRKLPFGGVGGSGMGSYHGEHSITTFSQDRAVLRKLRGPDLAALVRPPFTNKKIKMIRR